MTAELAEDSVYAVEARGIHKSFGALEVLAGVDLLVRKGEVTVILGPSGSGKSTLLRTSITSKKSTAEPYGSTES